jgi:hypothetical protein
VSRSNLAISVSSGLALKSFTIRRIDETALLKSRLASDTAVE